VSAPSEEPTWQQRAVERSTRAAKLPAEQWVQRFLNAAEVWDFCTKGFARG